MTRGRAVPHTPGGPLVAAAVLGMVVIFGAGWAVGHGGDDRGERKAASERSITAGPGPQPDPSAGGSDDGSVRAAARVGSLPAPGKVAAPPIGVFTCPKATVTVTSGDQLRRALGRARPGASIRIADGLYTGEFETARDGTAKKPIYLCGSRNAILEAGAIKGGYTLHFDGASYWRADGFTVRNGQKGVVVDDGTGIGLQKLLVEDIGDEAVHLRTASSGNVLRGLTVRDTGLRKPKYGEGIYIGTAQSNWCTYTRCKPDQSDNNWVLQSSIYDTPAENIDIKEGTSGGVVAGNRFDGKGMTAGDSWVDVKGNGWLISGNTGVDAPLDGYQVHEIEDGLGWRNLFSANKSMVDAGGYAINVTKRHSGNVVLCNNTAQEAGDGLTTIDCSK